MDPYSYVGNNPETLSDPTGRMFACPHCGDSGAHDMQPTADTFVHHTFIKYSDSGLPPVLYLQLYRPKAFARLAGRLANQGIDLFRVLSTQALDLLNNGGIDWGASPELRALFAKLTIFSVGAIQISIGSTGSNISENPRAFDDLTPEVTAHIATDEHALHMEADFCSFTPSTRVTIDHGKQAIGALRVGDRVLAYNPKTHRMELEPVLHVWIHTDNDLVDLTITTTTKTQGGKAVIQKREVVHTNKKHPFLTRERGFLSVGQITLKMHILRADGQMGVVTGWKLVPGVMTMYNLEVAQDHTFTVGDGQWIVHNSEGGCGSGGPLPYTLGDHIKPAKLAERGWTTKQIEETLADPARIAEGRDTRRIKGGGNENDPATAYYSRDGGYVLRNDVTGDIVQVSDRNRPWNDPIWNAP